MMDLELSPLYGRRKEGFCGRLEKSLEAFSDDLGNPADSQGQCRQGMGVAVVAVVAKAVADVVEAKDVVWGRELNATGIFLQASGIMRSQRCDGSGGGQGAG